MFATGIENSIPTIHNGRTRVDQMASCGHYKHWKLDFDLVEDMGLEFLRYGPPLHTTYLGPGRYDWEFADLALADLRRRGIVPIIDLCHFGVPDWIGNFQNPDFPQLFAMYAADFAERYPWVQLYTPVNEMFVCAIFSAKYGWWNEQGTTDTTFVTALKHIVKANVLGMIEILKRKPNAIFIQSESSEYFHADSPNAIHHAEVLNRIRFLSLDLNYGNRVNSDMYEYLLDNGMSREEYNWFLEHRLKQHCILGNDYYWTNEHRVYESGRTTAAGETFGYAEITRQYYERYGLPVMHTETNYKEGPKGDEAVQWLWKEWANVLRIRNVGIPTVGFTWYSLTDQMDWDTALREVNDRIHPVGLYDLDRNIRPVGQAYKKLIQDWRGVLPASSHCLVVPVEPLAPMAAERARRTRKAAAGLKEVPAEPQTSEVRG
jgi:beta-glucosidase/6-phospho-beta-glucosidase/beta-galactosidase